MYQPPDLAFVNHHGQATASQPQDPLQAARSGAIAVRFFRHEHDAIEPSAHQKTPLLALILSSPIHILPYDRRVTTAAATIVGGKRDSRGCTTILPLPLRCASPLLTASRRPSLHLAAVLARAEQTATYNAAADDDDAEDDKRKKRDWGARRRAASTPLHVPPRRLSTSAAAHPWCRRPPPAPAPAPARQRRVYRHSHPPAQPHGGVWLWRCQHVAHRRPRQRGQLGRLGRPGCRRTGARRHSADD